ncbi:MAG: pilin [Patescibacteria group bacterium]|jgi:hypothetical protein
MLKNFLKPLLFFCYLLSVFCFLAIPAQAISDSSPYWGDFVAPPIQIPIPTVSITKDSVKCEGDYCEIPWIGQYVAGIYKYAIGVVGIIAAIMLMVGGVRWLTAGGNASAVTDAQSYITGSLTGLVLALLSYTILYTINPALVSFKPIRVKMVEKVDIMSNTGGLSCSAITNESECNADKQQLGYEFYKGAECPGAADACKNNLEDYNGCMSGRMCCCTRSAQAGCSWATDPTDTTCGNNARQVSEYSKCGTNTGGMSTCCCNWASEGGGDAQKLLNCIQGATSGFGSGSIKGSTESNKQCCENWTPSCGHSQTRSNSCHFGCKNGYQTMAIDWGLGGSRDCNKICETAKNISSKCSGDIKGSILGPTFCPSCSGYNPYQDHDDHFHMSVKGCIQ